jgi:hypothetical protein
VSAQIRCDVNYEERSLKIEEVKTERCCIERPRVLPEEVSHLPDIAPDPTPPYGEGVRSIVGTPSLCDTPIHGAAMLQGSVSGRAAPWCLSELTLVPVGIEASQ